MDKDLKEEIKDILEAIIKPLVVEFKAGYDSHGKEIERLTKQSGEHYEDIKGLKESIQKQVQRCQNNMNDSQEKSGHRIGELEQLVARMDEHIKTNATEILTMKNNKQFNITQALTVVGVLAMIVLGVITLVRG